MSYTKSLILSTLPIYYEGYDIWLVQVPLNCFDIVEMHCPDRVMRQFGLSQHILDYIDTTKELHSVSRQGKRKGN